MTKKYNYFLAYSIDCQPIVEGFDTLKSLNTFIKKFQKERGYSADNFLDYYIDCKNRTMVIVGEYDFKKP